MNIKDYNKAEILAALYNNAKVQGLGFLHADSNNMHKEEAEEILEANPRKYFDYLKGRVMKIDLSRNNLNTYLYNRDNGQNAAEEIINNLKK